MELVQQARNADLADVLRYLEDQHQSKYDAVIPSTHMRYASGELVVNQGATLLEDDGVRLTDAVFRTTDQFEDHLSARLEIPRQYLRKMRGGGDDGLGLLDQNVNHWLRESQRNWFVRAFRSPSDPYDVGIARAFLSDSYKVIDHLDAVYAVFDGVSSAGVSNYRVTSADLSERRLRVKIEAPEITAAAPMFLHRYRGANGYGIDNPLISAGLVVSNSETGGAAFQIAPQITILVCKNGMTRTVDALRKVHLGERMDAGAIEWSESTKRHSIDLIRSQATDAVRSFLSPEYLTRVARQLDEQGDVLLDRPAEVLDSVGKKLRYSEEERDAILDRFISGGDPRAAGVVQVFTAYARDVENPDRAAEIEEQAFEILALAAQG